MLIENKKRRVTPCCGFTDLRKRIESVYNSLDLASLFIFVHLCILSKSLLSQVSQKRSSSQLVSQDDSSRLPWQKYMDRIWEISRRKSWKLLAWLHGNSFLIPWDQLHGFDIWWFDMIWCLLMKQDMWSSCKKSDVEHWDLTILHIVEIDQANLWNRFVWVLNYKRIERAVSVSRFGIWCLCLVWTANTFWLRQSACNTVALCAVLPSELQKRLSSLPRC